MRARRYRGVLKVALAVLVLASIVLIAAVAAARPGGGSSFSGGSSSRSSSSSSSSGGSSDGGALVELLIWLCIEHPAIGIPLLLVVIGVAVVKKLAGDRASNWSTAAQRPSPAPYGAQAQRPRPSIDVLRQVDPGFSSVVFEDFLYSLYTEVHRARGAAMLDRLSAYLAPGAAQTLMQLPRGEVQGVIVGAMRVLAASASPQGASVTVQFESNYTEAGRGYYAVESWILSRKPGARSRTPDRVRVLGCPGCGAPQDALFGGQCRHCGRTVNDGSFDWVVQQVHLLSRENRAPMLTADVQEKGTHLPSISDPSLGAALHGMRTKDPAFDVPQFQQRVGLVFNQFQVAWSARDLGQMRPFLSDALFSTQEYYVAAYTAQRLRNVTERARITNMELIKISSDPFFDAVTVRLWATGLDYTVSDDGKVVSGSRSRERAYSEYWTLIRGTNRKGPTKTELACANCGAPLSVNMVGHCNYCKVKVTTGDFDWVLSRIEQDESYTG